MKTNLYLLALIVLFNFSCGNKKQASNVEAIPQKTPFPYQMDSVPSTWVAHQNDWFDFYLPPDWKLAKRSTFDSHFIQIFSPDSTNVLISDDYGFGEFEISFTHRWPGDVIEVDSLSGEEGQLYYNLDKKEALLILYETYWVSTADSSFHETPLTETQFETVCMILQTVRLRPRIFSYDYFETYQNGQLFREPDLFKFKVDDVTSRFSEWGFTLEKERILDKLSDFEQHWWLKIFKGHGHYKDTTDYPKPRDWKSIKAIRQFTFKKNWQFVLEEWQLEDDQAARRWLDIAVNTQKLDDHKPPREYWIYDDKLYFVMATAAQDWSLYGGELVQHFSGRPRWFLHLFNDPLDLKAYKKRTGANSATKSTRPYFYKPDTIGTYYEYLWFHHLRQKYPSQSFEGLKIKTYIYGDEIGTYDDVEEALIGVKSRLSDPRLGQLNLVGRTKEYLIDNLGDIYILSNELMIYQHNGDLLICHLMNGKVDWFNFIRTNLSLESIKDLPEELRYYEERVPK